MPELPPSKSEPIEPLPNEEVRSLFTAALEHSAKEAAELLTPYPDSYIETVLELLNPALRQELLDALPRDRRERVLSIASPDNRRQWLRNDAFPENTVGRLMEPALAVFDLDATVGDAIARIRQLVVR